LYAHWKELSKVESKSLKDMPPYTLYWMVLAKVLKVSETTCTYAKPVSTTAVAALTVEEVS
jgi:hypothetical protein